MREGWQKVQLGELATQVKDSVKVISGAEYVLLGVSSKGRGVFSKEAVTSDTSKAKSFTPVRCGQFIYNRLFAGTGSFGVVPEAMDGTFVSNEFPVFDVDPSQLDVRFLGLTFEQPSVWADVEAQCIGSTGSRMRWKEDRFNEYRILLPPLAEQRRIVDLIGAVDEVWLKTKALVDALGELESSVLDDLIWDRGHQVTQLRDVVSERGLIGGPFGSSLVSADYIEDGVPVIRGANLSEGRFEAGDFVFVSPEKSDSLKRNRAIPGDLVATQRGTLGQVALVSDRYPEYLVSQSQMRLRPDAALATAEYVYSALSTGRAKAAIEVRKIATANPHINLGIFGETEIPLPTLDAQIEVSKTHEALEDQHSALAAILGCLELCRRALLSDLLSGAHEIPDSYDDFLEAS